MLDYIMMADLRCNLYKEFESDGKLNAHLFRSPLLTLNRCMVRPSYDFPSEDVLIRAGLPEAMELTQVSICQSHHYAVRTRTVHKLRT